jgi:lipoprotein-anchoring transpeptidase ErfK/SrfK
LSEIASGRYLRPLALLVSSAALFALTAAGSPPARAALVVVQPRQELVALFGAHKVHAAHAARSALVGVVPPTAPITGSRTVLPVLGRHGRWVKVRLPGRPNGHAGWISAHATVRAFTSFHIVVDTSRRLVRVYRAGRPVRSFRAVVGKPSTPTPVGEFFVEESIALRAGDVGAPFALALSARSNVLQEFDGGPGQIALHGLANVGGVPGTAVSHGCVRLDEQAMRWLAARIGPGVPVTIVRG